MFFLPVPQWPHLYPPSETENVTFPERKTLPLLCISHSSVWHRASDPQDLS